MPAHIQAPGLIVAAPASGAGKTTVTLGLLRHFRNAGLRVSSFKVGPDYIDPAFHAAASGGACRNIDAWAMRPATISRITEATGDNADIVIGEGVMGLFDGAPDGTGSTADVAAATGWPIVLVVDASAQAASAAAVVHGFATFRDDVRLAGVIFNRVGSAGHRRALEAAMAGQPVPVLGALPDTPSVALPERHLGLVQAGEQAALDAFVETAAALIAEHTDTDQILGHAARPSVAAAATSAGWPVPGQRIAVASDIAFAFAYPHVLDAWRAAGAELLPFSPLADEAPLADADAIYLPGGYPELHAGRLASSETFMDGLRAAAGRGAAIFGECGGYMALGVGLVDGDGVRHPMAGLLPLETSFAGPAMHFGYRLAELAADSPLGPAGTRFRAHEFHYARILREDVRAPLFRCRDALGNDLGQAGCRDGQVSGSFIHLIDLEAVSA